VASLLPDHLPSLGVKRHIRLAGSTLLASSLFDAVSYILHHQIDITYEKLEEKREERPEESSAVARAKMKERQKKQQQKDMVKESRDCWTSRSTSARRSLGFGGFALEPGSDDSATGVWSGGREYETLIRPKGWAEIVATFFTAERKVGGA
jgi:hypothetical protein